MCLYPKLIKNRKYIPNKKNGGIVPEMKDERTAYVPIGCGVCMECMKQKARAWQVRLQEEIRNDSRGQFITFSYSDESIVKLSEDCERIRRKTISRINKMENAPYSKAFNELTGYAMDNAIATRSVRLFLERWRKKYGKSLKHWIVSELGQVNSERVHLHGLVWTNENKTKIEDIWKYGNVWIGDYVTEKTINYIVKYIYKVDEKHKLYKPVILTSPGIGRGYIDRLDALYNMYNGPDTKEIYITREGIKLPLPIYYRNKIYTDEEREELWLNLLDKQERYVDGIKIDVSENEDDYNRVIKQIREKNIRLGYGDDMSNESEKQYEKARRELKRLEIKNKVLNIDENKKGGS
jgi:hypothetical protein